MSIQYQRKLTSRFVRYAVHGALAASLAVLAACDSDSSTSPKTTGFLAGVSGNNQIGLVINSVGRSLTLFQLGNPSVTQSIALGTSSNISPVGFAIRGRRISIPLGDAASVAYVDLDTTSVLRFFTFTDGNTTGSAFVNDTTVIAANSLRSYVGRFTLGQANTSITDTVTVAPNPTAVVMTGTRAMVVSTNEDVNNNYQSLGNGVVTAVDPATMHVIGTVTTGGTNSQAAALGPDGLLYVINTGDYINPGSLTIINPTTLQAEATIPNMGIGPSDISIDANGLAYISAYYTGTLVWNTQTRQFVRDASNPVCAPVHGSGCNGASSSVTDAAGNLYQIAGGTGGIQEVYMYHAGTFALTDSISTGAGPVSLAVRTF